jgi:mRNA-degrading endonuclease RelE of RelBE toxin-antitoxin system
MDRFAETGHGDIRMLRGHDDEYRLRIGDVRVRFFREKEARTLVIARVLPRGHAYREDD